MPNVSVLRYSLAAFAALDSAAHLLPSPSGSALGQLWFYIEAVVYALLALALVLGLRRWYPVGPGFSALNLMLFIAAGMSAIPGVTSAPLPANLDPMHYDMGRAVSVISYLVLIAFGAVLWLRDRRGSRTERMH